MTKTLLGKWRGGPHGNVIKFDMIPEGPTACRAVFKGSKGGRAGFEGRLMNNGTVFKGYWHDADAGVTEADRFNCTLLINLDASGDSWTAKYGDKARTGGGEWTAERAPPLPRVDGKLVGFDSHNADAFARLTAPASPTRPDWVEAQRTAVLGATSSQRLFDGALEYIPPLAMGAPYDDKALRRSLTSSRHGGRQMVAGSATVALKGMDATVDNTLNPLGYKWEDEPYADRIIISRKLRAADRARVTATATAHPRVGGRPAFKPTLRDNAFAEAEQLVFLGLADATMGPDEVKKLAETARSTRPPPSPTAAKIQGRDVITHPRNAMAGYAHWTDAKEKATGMYEHIAEDPLATRKAQTDARLGHYKSVGERPAFSPVGPRVKPKLPPEPVPVPPPVATEVPKRASSADRGDKKPYNQYGKAHGYGPLSTYPEHLPDPMPDPRALSITRPVSPRGKPGAMSPRRNGSPGQNPEVAAAIAAAAEGAGPPWKAVNLPPTEQRSRLMPSVALRQTNLLKHARAVTR